jgi:hypothetical protein
VRQLVVCRKEPGLKGEFDTQMIPPAGEFLHAVGLALIRTVFQLQTARAGENRPGANRLVVQGHLVTACDRPQTSVTKVTPGRDNREIIINGSGHRTPHTGGAFLGSPKERYHIIAGDKRVLDQRVVHFFDADWRDP